MRKPSDYAHSFGEERLTHWQAADPGAAAEAQSAEPEQPEPQPQPMELATFRLIYESSRLCVFETRDGHLTAVDVNRLA